MHLLALAKKNCRGKLSFSSLAVCYASDPWHCVPSSRRVCLFGLAFL